MQIMPALQVFLDFKCLKNFSRDLVFFSLILRDGKDEGDSKTVRARHGMCSDTHAADGRPLAPGTPRSKAMKHDHMLRVRIAGSQNENWSGAAFDKSMTLSAFIRFSADLVANSLAHPDQLREFAWEVLQHVNAAYDATESPEVHQSLEKAISLLLTLERLGA